jgi:hypothetical protein
LAWSQYICLTAEQRESLYTAWLAGRDPESEQMVQEFFAEMDAVGAVDSPEAAEDIDLELEPDSELLD